MNHLAGGTPQKIKGVHIQYPEHCFTLYLPIYMNNKLNLPERFNPLAELVDLAMKDHWGHYKYIYLTVKNQYVEQGQVQNRCGGHVDGFLSDDENYVYVSGQPTEWVLREVQEEVSNHTQSLKNFSKYFSNIFRVRSMEPNTLYRLGKTIHRTPAIEYSHVRLFVKISFSNNKYNLEGNAINEGLHYDWKYYKRSMVRNHPTKSNTDSF